MRKEKRFTWNQASFRWRCDRIYDMCNIWVLQFFPKDNVFCGSCDKRAPHWGWVSSRLPPAGRGCGPRAGPGPPGPRVDRAVDGHLRGVCGGRAGFLLRFFDSLKLRLKLPGGILPRSIFFLTQFRCLFPPQKKCCSIFTTEVTAFNSLWPESWSQTETKRCQIRHSAEGLVALTAQYFFQICSLFFFEIF